VRELVGECELTGRHTIFTRNGRPAVILVSHDEYLALRETIEVGKDEAIQGQIAEADDQVKRRAVMEVEDLPE